VSDTTAGVEVIDLDAARLARAETSGKPKSFRLDGQLYELAPELPMESIFSVAEGLFDKAETEEDKTRKVDLMRQALRAILGDHYEEVRAKLSVPDAFVLLRGVLELYGTSLGEAQASGFS
jgi:hypothetical protein